MKTVRVVGQGVPARLSDDDAFCMVELMGDAEYCPKSVWKRWATSPRWTERGGRAAFNSSLTANDRQWLREKGYRR